MKISKDSLQYFVSHMPEKMELIELFDKFLLMAKIEKSNEEEAATNHYEVHDDLNKELDMWA